MKLKLTINHDISLDEAAMMTKRFRQGAGRLAIISTSFSKNVLTRILDQEKCTGIRMYYALDEENIPALVLVGVDENNNDITGGVLAERGLRCPKLCPEPNDLNS